MDILNKCRFCGKFSEKNEPCLCKSCKQKIFDWLNEKGWTVTTEAPECEDTPIKEKSAGS